MELELEEPPILNKTQKVEIKPIKKQIMSNPIHHAVNNLLIIIGVVSGAASQSGIDATRATELFYLSVSISLTYLIINAKHLVQAIKSWFVKDKNDSSETGLPPGI